MNQIANTIPSLSFGSLFAGIGGFDLGFIRAGLVCSWQVEIDKFCNQVLHKHWPNTRRFINVKEVGKKNLENVDLISGGFPCQDLSIAGSRAGFAGDRSSLWFEFERIIAEMLPKWVVIENVPGLLSSRNGSDFGIILKSLDGLGYGVAWRVLDSQYFGVPQRRRRLFIIGSFGSPCSGEVLFEREGLSRDFAKGRKAGKRDALTLTGGSSKCHSSITSGQQDPNVIIAGSFKERAGKPGGGKGILVDQSKSYSINAYSIPYAYALTAKCGYRYTPEDNFVLQGFPNNAVWEMSHPDDVVRYGGNIAPTLQKRMGTGGNQVPLVGIRRLTPTECCRLQGFPDNWNDIVSDSQRYKQLGNAVTVNVAEWIGKRIFSLFTTHYSPETLP